MSSASASESQHHHQHSDKEENFGSNLAICEAKSVQALIDRDLAALREYNEKNRDAMLHEQEMYIRHVIQQVKQERLDKFEPDLTAEEEDEICNSLRKPFGEGITHEQIGYALQNIVAYYAAYEANIHTVYPQSYIDEHIELPLRLEAPMMFWPNEHENIYMRIREDAVKDDTAMRCRVPRALHEESDLGKKKTKKEAKDDDDADIWCSHEGTCHVALHNSVNGDLFYFTYLVAHTIQDHGFFGSSQIRGLTDGCRVDPIYAIEFLNLRFYRDYSIPTPVPKLDYSNMPSSYYDGSEELIPIPEGSEDLENRRFIAGELLPQHPPSVAGEQMEPSAIIQQMIREGVSDKFDINGDVRHGSSQQ